MEDKMQQYHYPLEDGFTERIHAGRRQVTNWKDRTWMKLLRISR